MNRNYSNTATEAALAGGVTAGDTALTVAAFAGYPSAPFYAVIARSTDEEEVVLVTAVSGDTLTVERGADGTTAKSHSAGAKFLHVTVAADFVEANAHVNATGGVHGLAGAPVGVTDVQTLTNKTLTSPTITAPTVTGTASMASATFSGTITVTGAAALSSLTTSGNAEVGGSLTVTGSTTLTGALSGSTAVFSGTIAAAAATAATHLVQKSVTDGLNTRLTTAEGTLAAATAAATANALAKRDGSGRLKVATPAAVDDAAPKSYVDARVKTTTVTTMASRPTTGLTASDQVFDQATKQVYTYDGTYWRNGLAGHFVPAGATPGDYITGRAGSSVVTASGLGAATIPLGQTYSATPTFALVSPGDDDQNLGIVTPRLSASSTSQLAVTVRNYAGSALGSGTVQVTWHVIGYNN